MVMLRITDDRRHAGYARGRRRCDLLVVARHLRVERGRRIRRKRARSEWRAQFRGFYRAPVRHADQRTAHRAVVLLLLLGRWATQRWRLGVAHPICMVVLLAVAALWLQRSDETPSFRAVEAEGAVRSPLHERRPLPASDRDRWSTASGTVAFYTFTTMRRSSSPAPVDGQGRCITHLPR